MNFSGRPARAGVNDSDRVVGGKVRPSCVCTEKLSSVTLWPCVPKVGVPSSTPAGKSSRADMRPLTRARSSGGKSLPSLALTPASATSAVKPASLAWSSVSQARTDPLPWVSSNG